ncbi:uncharacterized protein EI90DRAFT_3054562, partial [Cantharellus anzutake]|uniref:uncharacterized protein n=1 Tax=Cantharellus anzutake TaxID=1750568 RepID=UPI0019057735
MAPAMASFPPASPSSRAILNIPALGSIGESLSLHPSLEQLAIILPVIPEEFSIILSSSPQEIADVASAAYSVTDSHVIHVFNHYDGAPQVSVIQALEKFGYGSFDYFGNKNPRIVLVSLNGVFANSLRAFATTTSTIGLIVVRVLQPWDMELFKKVVPTSAKYVHILEEVMDEFSEGALYGDVVTSLVPSKNDTHPCLPTFYRMLDLIRDPQVLRELLSELVGTQLPLQDPTTLDAKKLVFIGSSTPRGLPLNIVSAFTQSKTLHTRYLPTSDIFSNLGGVEVSRVILAPLSSPTTDFPFNTILPLEASGERISGTADFTAILDPRLLKTHDVLRHAHQGSPVLIFTSMSTQDLLGSLVESAKQLIPERDLKLFKYDDHQTFGDGYGFLIYEALAHIAFLRLYVGNDLMNLTLLSRALLGSQVDQIPVDDLVNAVWEDLEVVPVLSTVNESLNPISIEPPKATLQGFDFNATSLDDADAGICDAVQNTAKHIIFREAFKSTPDSEVLALRPEVPTDTYLITCTVNKRLTPLSYGRNLFHLEFDIGDTGLTYKIGEALGIHGWNDEGDVLDFCRWYGVDPNAVLSIPLPSSAGRQLMATRTVFQALQQNLDIFGKPPKSFFAALATYAKDRRERMALHFIASAEGAATLKKFSEVDTVSYADVLQLYPSARPNISELATIVEEIKERHYSIASAQSVVGNRVDLLVVTVDWVTPSGALKYGQCTRYLAALKPGTKVTVSIKPSVMKLPPSDLQPVIMAGLGTGAAPFRAFMQHRALQVSLGKSVGPLVYYFGSRHRSQEYLYGEEIEAYIKDGIIAHAGLAFSRDSDSKVYIQHKMRNDGKMLADMISGDGPDTKDSEKGVFYLCGPTWPVPDVFEALVNALVKYSGRDKSEAGAYLESLKEQERYVLE